MLECLVHSEGHYYEVWPCWRMYVIVVVDSEVSYAPARSSFIYSLLLLAVDQDVELSATPAPRLLARHGNLLSVGLDNVSEALSFLGF